MLLVVIIILGCYVFSQQKYKSRKITERFALPLPLPLPLPQRSDTGESSGYERDLRFTDAAVDLTGRGSTIDFCRAVYKKGKPHTRRIMCALGLRDGMSPYEWIGPTAAEGFRWSRDDYWKPPPRKGKPAAYCRILRDRESTGDHTFASFCSVAGPDGFIAGRLEERDASPPTQIQQLLRQYEGCLVWWRWQDDDGSYTDNALYEIHGTPVPPSESAPLRSTACRGFQFNRPTSSDTAPPLTDYLRWGEEDSQNLEIENNIPPREIRAFTAWIWWDSIGTNANIWESSNGGKRELVRLFAEGGGVDLAAVDGKSAREAQTANYIWEIWDTDGRLCRLEGGAGSAKAGKWQHVVVTTADTATWWPTWQIWIDGELKSELPNGRAIPAMSLAQNFLARGFRGCLQDVRFMQEPMTPTRIREAMAWSKSRLHPQP